MNPINMIVNELILKELETFPLQAVIWGIIEGNNYGQIFELSDKSILILETLHPQPFVFVAGPLTTKGVEEIVSFISDYDCPTIYCKPKFHSLFLDKGYDFQLRAEMHLEQKFIPKPIHDGFTIIPIQSPETFQKCLGFNDAQARYGSTEGFFKFGKGYILQKEHKILSEAYADYIGSGCVEIGVITHPDYRSQGFGEIVTIHLIEQLVLNKLRPVWSCQINNRASMRLAFKLGFSISNYYCLMTPGIGNTLSKPLINWIRENPTWDI